MGLRRDAGWRNCRRRLRADGLHRMRFVGAREGVHAFAVKREAKRGAARATQPALPPQRYGGRSRSPRETGFNPGAHTTGSSRFREGRRGRSASPDTGQRAAEASCSGHVARARGEAGRVPLSGLLSPCRSSATGCARRWAALRLLAPRSLPLSAAAQTRLDPVIITATREPQALSRSSADVVVIDAETIRNTQRRFGRGPAAPRRRRADRAQRRPGPDLGLLRPRHRHEQHRGAGRRRARRLGDARPGRVRGAEPRPDRPHRGPARPGVEPLRRRRASAA